MPPKRIDENYRQAERRRQEVIRLVSSGVAVKDAVAQVGVSISTYKKWRENYGRFRAEMDAARNRGGREEAAPRSSAGFNFAKERSEVFGHDSPAFQLEVVEAMESLPPGNILMVLFPPEHGKTTLFEDYACLRLAHDPSWRSHVASETITLSKKVLHRVRSRLDPPPGSHLERWVDEWGPFLSRQPGDRRKQIWTATHFNVWKKRTVDERDYSMAALGFGSQIIGSRSDHLHGDDLQSVKTLGRSQEMFEEFQQDWLSRPGESGRTTIFGNRVDEGDFYEWVEESLDRDLLRVIRYPAIILDGEGNERPLWPERWPLDKLDRMRRKIRGRDGNEDKWERNWMQRPRTKGTVTFSPEDFDACKHPLLRLGEVDVKAGPTCYIGLDPAIGGRNVLIAVQVLPHALRIVEVDVAEGLANNEQIMGRLSQMLASLTARGLAVTDVVIEAKNFQAGLSRDERLGELRAQYGFSIREHMTGVNKYDESVGVPMMSHTLIRRELQVPWGDDDRTRYEMGGLRSEFLAWRPKVRGSKLRQDMLMALWFVWILWRERGGARSAAAVSSTIQTNRAVPHGFTQYKPGLWTPGMVSA